MSGFSTSVRPSDEARIEDTLAALDAGDAPDSYFEIVLDDAADIQTITRPTSLALFQVIA